MLKPKVALFLCLLTPSICLGEQEQPLLLQMPAVSKDKIAFVYAGDLWIAGRDGGQAVRLTTHAGTESNPRFSPDGSMIAFTGEYDGNVDVYTIPVEGGIPQRLTYHPMSDEVLGFTPDGQRVLFRSMRDSFTYFRRFYTIPISGGTAEEVPLPMGTSACYSPDGRRLAYVPCENFQKAWKRYRGGLTQAIWIADLPTLSIESIEHEKWNDFNPMWLDTTIYFLSDRNGPVTLFAYDINSKQVRQVLANNDLDFKSASAASDAIVYEQFGSLHLYDLGTGTSQELSITIASDLPEVRPHFRQVKTDRLTAAGLSPSGARAVFETRGEIITVPAEKGDIRNITRSTSVADRDPAWSPDGKSIAYFSDESGEYALHIRDQNGLGEIHKINLGEPPSYFYSPRWSPDSKNIAYTDKRLNVWYVKLSDPKPVRVDTDLFEQPDRTLAPVWSPDSRWLAYCKQLPNHMHAVFVYSLSEHQSRQVTDGMSDALYPEFDKGGKYLYFTSSTDMGLSTGWLDLSSINLPFTRSVYIVVLKKGLPSPLAPESDEETDSTTSTSTVSSSDEKGHDKRNEAAKKTEKGSASDTAAPVNIDFENILQRTLALPVPARDYLGIKAGKEGTLFMIEGPDILWGPTDESVPPMLTVRRFDLAKRKAEPILDSVNSFTLSINGEKMLYRRGEQWFVASATEVPKPGDHDLALGEVSVYVDPSAEWNQMYHEVWRIERDFFYDPGHHGLDLTAAEEKYAAYLENLSSRSDLNYLFQEMLGELSVGHLYVGGGESPEVTRVKVGLLGADFTVDRGRFRFSRIYSGENWNPQARAPLTQPGVEVVPGEYLLAVNGRDVTPALEVYGYFEGTAGKAVTLKVGPTPDGANARDVIVVPVESDLSLRGLAWIEGNRNKVNQLSGGKLAYVYLPNTYASGYNNFNRYYFSQIDKQGAIIDERFNGGGNLPDYFIDHLRRPLLSLQMTREGRGFPCPLGAIFGPKVMIINEAAGSGGDALPWFFRKTGIGPLVGKRTWGGLIGIYDYPQLMDGGYVTAPRIAIYGLDGEWEVENSGIEPDFEVEQDPKLVREGHDPQLEKAVEIALQLLEKNPTPEYRKPTYPDYHIKR